MTHMLSPDIIRADAAQESNQRLAQDLFPRDRVSGVYRPNIALLTELGTVRDMLHIAHSYHC